MIARVSLDCRQLYNATIDTFSGAYLLLGVGLGTVQVGIILFVVRHRREINAATEQNEEEKSAGDQESVKEVKNVGD